MTVKKKPEVNLEISSGFFRIPTREMTYNITVISDRGGVQVVEKIVEVEKQVEATGNMGSFDPYYQQVCQHAVNDLGGLLSSLTSLVEMGCDVQAGVDRQKIEQAKEVMLNLEKRASGNEGAHGADRGATVDVGGEIAEIVGKLQQMKEMLEQDGPVEAEEMPASPDGEEKPVPGGGIARRYFFDLDVVFQTLYELCTNETVKSHITKARENRDAYFEKELFLDSINEKVAGLEADSDNFFNLQMSEVLSSLLEACNEKPIQNLLKKMDANQSSIFLDSLLPLEVPEAEEIASQEGEIASFPEQVEELLSVAEGTDVPASQLSGLADMLDEVLGLVDAMVEKLAESGTGEEAAGSDQGTGNEVWRNELAEAIALIDGALNGQGASSGEVADLNDFQTGMLTAVLSLQQQLQLKKQDKTIEAATARQQATSEAERQAEAASGREAVLGALRAAGIVA